MDKRAPITHVDIINIDAGETPPRGWTLVNKRICAAPGTPGHCLIYKRDEETAPIIDFVVRLGEWTGSGALPAETVPDQCVCSPAPCAYYSSQAPMPTHPQMRDTLTDARHTHRCPSTNSCAFMLIHAHRDMHANSCVLLLCVLISSYECICGERGIVCTDMKKYLATSSTSPTLIVHITSPGSSAIAAGKFAYCNIR